MLCMSNAGYLEVHVIIIGQHHLVNIVCVMFVKTHRIMHMRGCIHFPSSLYVHDVTIRITHRIFYIADNECILWKIRLIFAFVCHIACLHAIIQIHIVINIMLSIETVGVTLNLPFLKGSCFSENNPCMVFSIGIIGNAG